jgi:hypothetical protein
MTHRQYRYYAYRQSTWFIHKKRLGKGNRICLPACVVVSIHREFPLLAGDEPRVQFQEATAVARISSAARKRAITVKFGAQNRSGLSKQDAEGVILLLLLLSSLPS